MVFLSYMVRVVYELLKQDVELAKTEVLEVLGNPEYELLDNYLVVGQSEVKHLFLGYTRAVYNVLFECDEGDFDSVMSEYLWESVFAGKAESRFFVRTNFGDEKKVAGFIWRSLKTPVVDMDKGIGIYIFKSEGSVIVCTKLYDVNLGFENRKAHKRAKLHPTAMHPRLSACCINLSGKSSKSAGAKLLDPFCGSGGILIEAVLMGYEVTGVDIDINQITNSRANLDFYDLHAKLLCMNALDVKNNYDCIVTDVPYGKSSKKTDKLDKLFSDFLKVAYGITDSVVILFPDFVDAQSLIGDWKIKYKFEYYLHKSLSKVIFVLRK